MKFKNIFSVLVLLSIFSCGKDEGGGGGSGKSADSNQSREYVEATPGSYYTVLRPINFHSNGFIPYGTATFKLNNDQLQVSTSLDDDQAVKHRQTLHIGTRCPTLSDDTNGDSFIDYNEAIAVVGSAIMPLDNDLNSQLSGAEVYPVGRSMTYNRSASLSAINADLWKADEDPSDNIMKLARGKGIGFEARVVLVHGTAFQSSFPTSLATYKDEAAHLSLPIVCGILTKVE
jgi:hypothetical protein